MGEGGADSCHVSLNFIVAINYVAEKLVWINATWNLFHIFPCCLARINCVCFISIFI